MVDKIKRDKMDIQRQRLRLARMKRDAARAKAKKEKEKEEAKVRQERGRLNDLEVAMRETLGLSND